ncbi:hypothetical protein SCA31_24090, partial [Chryseobacterium sp. SIMBA_028]
TNTNRTVPTQIGTATNWLKIYAGSAHTVGLKIDGTLWAWGFNAYGQLGDGTFASKNVPVQIGTATNWQTIIAGSAQTIAIKTNGTL